MYKILFLTAILLSVSGCHKFCKPNKYHFEGGVSNVNPNEDSVHIGDTIWFKCIIPVNLKYNTSSTGNEYYNSIGASNLITDVHLTTPTGINMQNGAVDSFGFVSLKGALKSNPLSINASKTLYFELENNQYINKFGMIAKKKGIYFLTVIDIYQAMKHCDKFSISILMQNPDNHLYYLKNTYYGGLPINSVDSSHTYCFKVY